MILLEYTFYQSQSFNRATSKKVTDHISKARIAASFNFESISRFINASKDDFAFIPASIAWIDKTSPFQPLHKN